MHSHIQRFNDLIHQFYFIAKQFNFVFPVFHSLNPHLFIKYAHFHDAANLPIPAGSELFFTIHLSLFILMQYLIPAAYYALLIQKAYFVNFPFHFLGKSLFFKDLLATFQCREAAFLKWLFHFIVAT